jgi:hypothetical protein
MSTEIAMVSTARCSAAAGDTICLKGFHDGHRAEFLLYPQHVSAALARMAAASAVCVLKPNKRNECAPAGALIRLEKKTEENPKTLQDLKELELLVERGDRAEVNRKVQEILAR